jgi:RNA 2',3'-cyclic 3'-phosphodiesterase
MLTTTFGSFMDRSQGSPGESGESNDDLIQKLGVWIDMPPNEIDAARTNGNVIPIAQMRVFVGVKIAPEIASQLALLARELEQAPVKLVAAADIHLTLVPPWNETSISEAIEKLRVTVGRFSEFALTFQHLGYGPQAKRPRLLWVECEASNEITTLQNALLYAYGQSDERPFRPHVTLARLRGNGAAIARRHPIGRELSFTQQVDSVELFRSPPPGATGYQILASLRLADSPLSLS